MDTPIHKLAALSFVDQRLDELKDEFGDLPEKVKNHEEKIKRLKLFVDETAAILDEIKKFVAGAKITLVELKTKEEKLAQQQFLVRNNKEFDAISHEIEHLKTEHEQLSARMRTEGIKEDNLKKIYEAQLADYESSKADLDKLEEELKDLSDDQDDEVKKLLSKRLKIVKSIDSDVTVEYNRVRTFHDDAAVQIKKNSCSGCFSFIPPQLIVEIRNNYTQSYKCEHCGRYLIPEEVVIDEDLLKSM